MIHWFWGQAGLVLSSTSSPGLATHFFSFGSSWSSGEFSSERICETETETETVWVNINAWKWSIGYTWVTGLVFPRYIKLIEKTYFNSVINQGVLDFFH